MVCGDNGTWSEFGLLKSVRQVRHLSHYDTNNFKSLTLHQSTISDVLR